ncbi:MAG TPA: DUF1015 domain-containing protein [Anaerolineaceae bacterium]|nr:DUF1015 domain-containing protein [Anaerolineaceae bacterium]
MKRTESIGILVPRVYLPNQDVDLSRWAVIACDQYTSQKEYWRQVDEIVGNAPSTYKLILPEVYLGQENEAQRIANIQANMKTYLDEHVLIPHKGMVYVERTVGGKTRKGLVLALDLEKYDYSKGSQSLIRATEGTIVDRLPPRIKIREGGMLELPHIIVLIDDPQHTVIEAVGAQKAKLNNLYRFDLMCGGGSIAGYLVNQPEIERAIIDGLNRLAEPEHFQAQYGVDDSKAPLLFAVGDGNHSLATAKAIWEKIKHQVGMNHPARYALVEIENVHDEGLSFEPIHRVVFNVAGDLLADLQAFYPNQVSYTPVASQDEMTKRVDDQDGADQCFGMIRGGQFGVVAVKNAPSNLPVGTLQRFLDDYLKAHSTAKIDYVHGKDATVSLCVEPGNVGFYLPAMDKSDLFKTVILDGVLPRKTFSMGEAHEKRYYIESRRIV